MKAQRIRFFIFGGLSLVAIVAFLTSDRLDSLVPSVERDPALIAPSRGVNVAEPVSRVPVSRPMAAPDEPASTNENAPDMVSGLNAENGHIGKDLEIVSSLLETYYSVYHAFPMGDNADLMAAFTGKNPRGIEFFSKDSEMLNAQGELVDRWGTPFFFHRISGDLIEIRSGGPDGQVWTEDDFSSFEADQLQRVAALERY